ncbi:hypothetical protein GGS26DRAFT_80257 [Hypomontagnella submonticulosa]|nr:hypothetical protein GGS26DRAFT_80257 [Hypomontagnella submonticulosa]
MDRDDTTQRKLTFTEFEEKKTAEPAVEEKRTAAVEPKRPTPSEAVTPANEAGEDAANDGELSSPPDTSSVSSVNPDMLGDEIVVGTRANGNKSPARRAASERGDVDMPDAEEDEEPVSHYPKRKRRVSQFNDLSEDKIDSSLLKIADEIDAGQAKGKARPKFEEDNKHVPIGYWRDSPVPQEQGKHMVVGFIDVRDRLRTRIRGIDLKGNNINARLYRIPPGPGGSWVTFTHIVFLDHLIGHDHNVIKEYVKVRAETLHDRTVEADMEAIREAQRRLEANPPPETPQPPSIAWGRDVPEHAQSGRPEAKRRRYGSAVGTIAEFSERSERLERDRLERPEHIDRAERPDHTEQVERVSTAHQQMPDLPQLPRKPTRILVGCWANSSPPKNEDKHAVYGILGANDMFRVKLVRETMDGRFIDGNFPSGAGALWISYDDVTFVDHLKNLTRPEVKEYVRIRQAQIDAGETKDDQVANETKAVAQAQIRAAQFAAANPSKTPTQGHVMPSPSAHGREDVRETHELRQTRRDLPTRSVEPAQQSRHSHPEVEIRQASRPASNDPIERVQTFANREVARMEAVQMRTNRHQAHRNSMGNPNSVGKFNDNLQRMDHVWQAQETMRMGPANTNGNHADVMMHEGIKYERKQSGPFKDRLVSQGTIINIEGEDYVEYRVLTKPSFF